MLASNLFRTRVSVAALALFLTTSMSARPASADELPLTLQVLNYQAFSGPDLQSYMMRTKEQIRAHWHPKSNQPHTAKIFFQIFSDGSLLQHEIEQSSGDKAYDEEAKAVIVGCVPYPPPPPGSVRLINVLATFGANPGAPGASGASGYVGTPNLAGGGGSVAGGAGGYGNADSSAATGGESGGAGGGNYGSSASGGSDVNAGNQGSASESSRPPLQGTASETGMMQSSASAQQAPRFLQAEVGATGYTSPPMQGQAMASAPPMFQSQMAMQAPLQGGASGAQRPFLQADASHGAMTVGVLGCEFGLMNGQIRQILPGSDLLRYGIQPGDVIEAADGQPLRGRALQAYTRGTPGTYIQLTILHQGQLATFPIQRKDARVFSNYNGYFKKWAAQEKFW
jgi:hypothetical protein